MSLNMQMLVKSVVRLDKKNELYLIIQDNGKGCNTTEDF